MGVSISLHIFDKDKLVNDIHEYVVEGGGYRDGAHDARSFLELVGPEFGSVTGDKVYQVWNEYYEDYNAASEFLAAVTRYYFPNDDQDDTFWSSGYESIDGANANEVLEELFPDDFGWENGKFTQEEEYVD